MFKSAAEFATRTVLGLDPSTRMGGGLEFFVEDTLKIFVLLAAMIYAIAWIRAGLNIGAFRGFLAGRSRLGGYFLAALLGAITPFCSCSSIPIFMGFVSAGIPIGITMAFLITSPMINEAAVVMLGGILGWKLTATYIAMGFAAGILGGAVFDALRAERFLRPFSTSKPGCSCRRPNDPSAGPTARDRHAFAWAETRSILGRLWLWILIGVGLGAFFHGFLPDDFIARFLGKGVWWDVPLAVAIGIPAYANATGVIPAVGVLIEKGLPVGTALAFMMSTVAASVPEFVMLKQVMTFRLLSLFGLYLLVFFTLCGWLLNLCI